LRDAPRGLSGQASEEPAARKAAQMTAVQLKRKLRNFPVAKLQQKITTG
jgi:hypothetical protein